MFENTILILKQHFLEGNVALFYYFILGKDRL